MSASAVLQRCLKDALASMHALRRTALMLAVESLLAGRRLVLIDLARHWPGATRVRAPLKRLDRLLGNCRLHNERERVFAGMAQWLVRCSRPTLVVDWCRLKDDGRWHLLRAAVPVGGRTLTVFEMVFPQRLQGSPQAEWRFLQRLQSVLPSGTRPVLVTDAGFRAPWCRAVERLGWHWITRVRNRTLVKPAHVSASGDSWAACSALYPLARPAYASDLGAFDLVRRQPISARLVLYRRPSQGRRHTTLSGTRRRSKSSRQCARRETEPWLLAVAPSLQCLSVPQIVAIYRRRMQIELGFRDLKSHRFGQAFEDSRTRGANRIEVLLLLHALALLAAWLAGIAAQMHCLQLRLNPTSAQRRCYSIIRLGWEALARRWLSSATVSMLNAMRSLSVEAIENMGVSR